MSATVTLGRTVYREPPPRPPRTGHRPVVIDSGRVELGGEPPAAVVDQQLADLIVREHGDHVVLRRRCDLRVVAATNRDLRAEVGVVRTGPPGGPFRDVEGLAERKYDQIAFDGPSLLLATPASLDEVRSDGNVRSLWSSSIDTLGQVARTREPAAIRGPSWRTTTVTSGWSTASFRSPRYAVPNGETHNRIFA